MTSASAQKDYAQRASLASEAKTDLRVLVDEKLNMSQ